VDIMKNILIVCTGNICRSPMAEGLLRHAFEKYPEYATKVRSAGTDALIGHPADDCALSLMSNRHIDISDHRGEQLDSNLVRWANLILVMEPHHKRVIEARYPSARGKVFRLGEWDNTDIPDPYRHGIEAFRHALEIIEKGISSWLAKLVVI